MFGLKEIRSEIEKISMAQEANMEMLHEFTIVAKDISRQLEFCNHLASHMQKIDAFAEVIEEKMKGLNKMIYEYKKAVDMERKLYKMEKDKPKLKQNEKCR